MHVMRHLRKTIAEAERQGWRVEQTSSGIRLLSPDGVSTASVHTSPSCHRWEKNLMANLRRGGFEDPGRPARKSSHREL